jgi:hypothetical protein
MDEHFKGVADYPVEVRELIENASTSYIHVIEPFISDVRALLNLIEMGLEDGANYQIDSLRERLNMQDATTQIETIGTRP